MNYSHSWVFKAARNGCLYIFLNIPFWQKTLDCYRTWKLVIFPVWTPLSLHGEWCNSPPPPHLSQRRMKCWLFSSQQEYPLINMSFLRLVYHFSELLQHTSRCIPFSPTDLKTLSCSKKSPEALAPQKSTSFFPNHIDRNSGPRKGLCL